MRVKMTKREKLIERIRARPAEADFRDVEALLEMFGWTHQGKGEHDRFTKDRELPISIPTVSGRRVKRYILDQICIRLSLD